MKKFYFNKKKMMQSIYEYLFGKDLQADELQQIQEDCSGLQDFTHEALQPFCRESIGYALNVHASPWEAPITNPQLEEAKERDAKRKERIRLRCTLQSPKPVKPSRLEQPDKACIPSFRLVNDNMSYKDILMK